MAVAGGQRALRARGGPSIVERGEGGGVERDGAFGAELAERDLQPAAVARGVPEAVQFEVEQFTEARPVPRTGSARCGRTGRPAGDGGHQGPVDIGRERPGQRPVEAGDVEANSSRGRAARPSPRR